MSIKVKSENWFVVYREIAERLFILSKRVVGNPGKYLYKRCIHDKEFMTRNEWILKFRPVYMVSSLDPIHLFSSFSGNNLGVENRIERINNILRILESEKFYDHIDFTGCPTPFIIHMIGARSEKMQDEVWKVFTEIYKSRQDGLNETNFKKASSWYGIDVSSFTIFLFWIDAKNFLPLDKNTIAFLLSTKRIPKKPKRFSDYKQLLTLKNSNVYKEVARVAYEVVELGKKIKKYPTALSGYISKPRIKAAKKETFKVIAVRLLPGIDKKLKKVLAVGELYRFYNYYKFISSNRIKIEDNDVIDLYNVTDLKIEISAIVGKNGTGKSTITELVYLAINNLSTWALKDISTTKLTLEKGLWMELYFITDALYRIDFKGTSIKILRYSSKGGEYFSPKPVLLKDFSLNNFFYTVAVNYSHFALNSNNIGPWIDNLFHKNDGYQVPIVINPYRNKGNMNVNVEEGLAKYRLLINILEPVLEQEGAGTENSRRMLTDTKYAYKLRFSLNKSKFKHAYESDELEIDFQEIEQYFEPILQSINDVFELRIGSFRKVNRKRGLIDYAKLYLVKKVLSIAIRYEPYQGYFEIESRTFTNITGLLEDLKEDSSHIGFKFKQAVNYFRFGHLKNRGPNFTILVDELSDDISRIVTDHQEGEEKLQNIHLIPPSFFDVKIFLKDVDGLVTRFEDLSSGEKQRIYVTSSLVYHLVNLDSITATNFISYDCVNVIFDEIELYFHPDMQRTFIHYLLWYLEKVPLSNIRGLNFCFVTHSPFILSDIPKDNVLFLGEAVGPGLKTFGANIHELLMNGFFMANTLGEYALSRIHFFLTFYRQVDAEDNERKLKELDVEYQLKKKVFYFVVNSVGEEYLRKTLINHLMAIETKLKSITYVEWYKQKLMSELAKLDEHAKDQLPVG